MLKLEKKVLLILSVITVSLIILGIAIAVLVSKQSSPKEDQFLSDEEVKQKVLQSLSVPLSAERDEIAEGNLEEILESLSVPKE